MAFSVTSKQDETNMILEMVGAIDEDATFPPPNLNGAGSVIWDLEKVTAINSVGIREWIKWVKSFPTNIKMSVRRCPKIIVDQINMVSGFLPAGTVVQSFFVPYYSEASGGEKMVLFENGKEFGAGGLKPPAEVKDDSGELMEMDIIEAKYFKFLNG